MAQANLAFYEAAAQIIPILLLALAVGESRVKVRAAASPIIAMLIASTFGAIVIAGELAALRVLSTGHDSDFLHYSTVLSLAVGLSFLVKYLAWATYRDLVGPDEEPSLAAINALSFTSMFLALAVVIVLG